MSLHINRFLDRLRAAESRQQRDVTMTLTEARDLHADITRLLMTVEDLRSHVTQQNDQQEVVTINVEGGSF